MKREDGRAQAPPSWKHGRAHHGPQARGGAEGLERLRCPQHRVQNEVNSRESVSPRRAPSRPATPGGVSGRHPHPSWPCPPGPPSSKSLEGLPTVRASPGRLRSRLPALPAPHALSCCPQPWVPVLPPETPTPVTISERQVELLSPLGFTNSIVTISPLCWHRGQGLGPGQEG